MLHNNGASVVYFFIFDARQYFPQTRDAALRGSRSTILQKRVPLLTGVRSDTQRGGWAASPLVWVVAENGRPRKWYAGRVTRRDPAEPRPDSNRPERERKNGKKEESRERERRPPGEARNERRRREVHAQLI